jgi:hypothetical protein
MIVQLRSLPNQALLDVSLLCDQIGVDYAVFPAKGRGYPKDPIRKKVFGPHRVVVVGSIEKYQRIFSMLTKVKHVCLVYLCIAGSSAEEFGIDLTEELTEKLLFEDLLLTESLGLFPPERVESLYENVITKFSVDSILAKMHSLFYRIRDGEERRTNQKAVYKYLTGDRKHPPVTPIRSLNDLLVSDMAKNFILALRGATSEDLDERAEKFKVDRFDLGFVLRSSQME